MVVKILNTFMTNVVK